MNVLFICTGNICRSPLAEGILKSKYKKRNIRARVDSCGFEPYHIGDGPDPRAQQVAMANGIDLSDHTARLFQVTDFDHFDQIYVMDYYHYQEVMHLARNDEDRKKIDFLLNMVFPGENRSIQDPYFEHYVAFETVFEQLNEACEKIADFVAGSNTP